jgi:predicted O-methyltransferase YrrM
MSLPPHCQKLADLLDSIDLPKLDSLVDTVGLSPDIQGWGDQDPIFDYVMRQGTPQLIIEVGSWKGASAIRMADLQREHGISGLILCIDTWLGSNVSLWHNPETRAGLHLRNGYPSMFLQFVKNIMYSGHAERIRYLPMTSTCAAELLAEWGVQADAIYIDAGHTEDEVFTDIARYYPLVKPDGILFGDDYSASWPGTVQAVNRFVAKTGLKLMGTEWKWLVRKPKTISDDVIGYITPRSPAVQTSSFPLKASSLAFGTNGHIGASHLVSYRKDYGEIQGWFSDMSAAIFDSFLSLQTGYNIMGDIFEIGVAFGKSAYLLAKHSRAHEKIILNDINTALMQEVAARIKIDSAVESLCFGEPSSNLKFSDLKPETVRFMHIDGDHGRGAQHIDLTIADRMISADGLVVLDDFLVPQFLGLTVGALEWLALNPGRFEIILAGFNKGYLCRPSAAQFYLHFIRDALPNILRDRDFSDFTIFRMSNKDDFRGFGITNRQWDRDFVTLTTDVSVPESIRRDFVDI